LMMTVSDNSGVSLKELGDVNRIWGLHHALLQNKIMGALKEFEQVVKIVGLGYKALAIPMFKEFVRDFQTKNRDKKNKGEKEEQIRVVDFGSELSVSNKGLLFTLGYSHKICVSLPEGVTVDIDKPGQTLTFRSSDLVLMGRLVSAIKRFRPPEPYNGTGIEKADTVRRRKAGKKKS